MSAVNKLIDKLRVEASIWQTPAYSKALFVEAAQALSDQQDYIDNLERGAANARAEITCTIKSLSSLREDNARLIKLLEKDVHE